MSKNAAKVRLPGGIIGGWTGTVGTIPVGFTRDRHFVKRRGHVSKRRKVLEGCEIEPSSKHAVHVELRRDGIGLEVRNLGELEGLAVDLDPRAALELAAVLGRFAIEVLVGRPKER